MGSCCSHSTPGLVCEVGSGCDSYLGERSVGISSPCGSPLLHYLGPAEGGLFCGNKKELFIVGFRKNEI